MKCLRCDGLMVSHQVISASGAAWGWRCLLCGESTDPCIEMNRITPPPLFEKQARVPGTVPKSRKGRSPVPRRDRCDEPVCADPLNVIARRSP